LSGHHLELVESGEHPDPLDPSLPVNLLLSLLPLLGPSFFVRFLRLIPVVHPAEEAPGGVLGERIPRLARADRDIGVVDGAGGDENCRAGGEFNHKSELPEHKVPTQCRIEFA
jgi:hypothetical protein